MYVKKLPLRHISRKNLQSRHACCFSPVQNGAVAQFVYPRHDNLSARRLEKKQSPRRFVNTLTPFSAPKPECTQDDDCALHLACIYEKCKDPCSSTTCGTNAECRVTNHRAVCTCRPNYTGDPSKICYERKETFQPGAGPGVDSVCKRA